MTKPAGTHVCDEYTARGPAIEGEPPARIPDHDPLLRALIREHGTVPARRLGVLATMQTGRLR